MVLIFSSLSIFFFRFIAESASCVYGIFYLQPWM